MNYIFNEEKITALLTDFYTSTGIAVTLYDASMRRVATSPIYSKFCACLQAEERTRAFCRLSDQEHMRTVGKTGESVLYSCHAGVMEMISPIFYENTLIAYMQMGQFRDAENVYSSKETAERVFRENGLLDGRVELFERLPVVAENKRNALVNMMEVIVKSFWVDGLIYSKRSMLSVKIDRYIDEHLQEKICLQTLCDAFYLSKNALYRLFRVEFSSTVNEYVLKKRMARAKELLTKNKELDVAQVSALCGFFDYNYFIRAFRKFHGITPYQFKKSSD